MVSAVSARLEGSLHQAHFQSRSSWSYDRMSTSFLRRQLAELFGSHTGRSVRRRARLFAPGKAECLEPRLALSATPAVQVLTASTSDSKSITIEYQVNEAVSATTPLQFGIYRSSNSQ